MAALMKAAAANTAAAYAAVPDISADREAGVPTIATFLGLRVTLWLCLGLYLLAAACAFWALKGLTFLLGAVYVTLMLRSLAAGSEVGVMKIYLVFPFVNTFAGAAIFWWVLWSKTAFWPQF